MPTTLAQRLRPIVSVVVHHAVLLLGVYLFFTGFFPSKLSLPGYAPKFSEVRLKIQNYCFSSSLCLIFSRCYWQLCYSVYCPKIFIVI
jgi:hypothetical protein